MLGRYDEVIHYFDDIESGGIVEAERIGAVGLAYALKGDQKNTEKYLKILQENAKSPDGFASDAFVFVIHAVLGDMEKAFDWIQSGIETK